MESKIDTIKALTIRQPWASAIANGKKKVETRGHRTCYRGPLLIHAGQSRIHLALGKTRLLAGIPDLHGDPPLGAIIAVCELVDCIPTAELALYSVPVSRLELNRAEWRQELALGDYSAGRYGWVLNNVRKLPEPIPYRGQQGLWNFPVKKLPAGVLHGN